jgi:hypothetical protein
MSTKQMHRLRTHVTALSCAQTLFRLLLLSTWSSSRRPRARPRSRMLMLPRMRILPRMRVLPGRLLPNSDWFRLKTVQFSALIAWIF